MKTIKSIPFKYFNVDWTINYVDEIPHNDDNYFYGQTHFDKREILISTQLNDNPIPLITQQRTLYHELGHIILAEGGYNDESSDESLVEWIGKSLYDLIQNSNLFNK